MVDKKTVTKEEMDIAVLDQRLESFDESYKEFKTFIRSSLKDLLESNKAINDNNIKILLKINTLETKQRIYIAIFGTIAGLIGSHLPNILKTLFVFITPWV